MTLLRCLIGLFLLVQWAVAEPIVCFQPLPPLVFSLSNKVQTLTLKNGGDSALGISQIVLRDANLAGASITYFRLDSAPQLPVTVGPKETFNLTIVYSPGASTPPHFDALEITTNSETYKVVSVVLKGLDETESEDQAPSVLRRIAIYNHDAWVFPTTEAGSDKFQQPYWKRPGFWDDFLVFNKITGGMYDPPTQFTFLNHDVVKIRVANIHPDLALVIESMNISSTKFQLVDGNYTFPMTISPGKFVDVSIAFIENQGEKGHRTATLTIFSNDDTEPEIILQLSGAYMTWREDTNELSFQQISNTFGYTSYVYHEIESGYGSFPERWTAALVGEEVRSRKWERADLSKPVYARSLAAFLLVIKEAPEAETLTILGEGGGQVSIDPRFGQSFLPLAYARTGLPAEGNFTTNGPFSVILSHNFDTEGGNAWSSDNPNWVNMHFIPIRDRRGVMLKDTYIVGHDFILPRGCCKGPGCANCDYNDNIYLISNIKPVDEGVYIPSYDIGDPKLVLRFDTTYPGTLGDKNNATTGFVTTIVNDLDFKWGSNSYQPSNLLIDTEAKTFSITSLLGGGNNQGAINRLVNAMALVFNTDLHTSYTAHVRINGPLTYLTADGQETGMMLGATKDTFAKISLFYDATAGVVLQFILEQQSKAAAPAYAVITNPGGVKTLDLVIVANPETAMLVPMFMINGGNPTLLLSSGSVRVRDPHYGMFFGPRSRLSIFAGHSGAPTNEFTVTFSTVALEPLQTSTALTEAQKSSDLLKDLTGFTRQPDTCFPPPPVPVAPPVAAPPPKNPSPLSSPSDNTNPSSPNDARQAKFMMLSNSLLVVAGFSLLLL